MKNKSINNDSHLIGLIKESIIFETKKQSLAESLLDKFRMFENKFKSFDNNTDKIGFNTLIKQFEDFVNLFQDDVRRMARQSDMFEQRNRRKLMEGSKYIEENFPDYKKFLTRFLNCENSQQCLFLTNKFVDECQMFIRNVKKELTSNASVTSSSNQTSDPSGTNVVKISVNNVLDFLNNKPISDVINILAEISKRNIKPKSLYLYLKNIINKYHKLLGNNINLKKLGNNKVLLKIKHPNANDLILDMKDEVASKA